MAGPKQSRVIPPVTNWGGTRSIQRRLERSNTLIQNREAVSYALLCMANTKITDIMTWDEDGNVKVKAAHQIPEAALQSIKKVSVRTDKDGNSYGLLDNPDENDKPSVIDVNVVAPATGET